MKLQVNQYHLGGADGLRAIACLAVIFHHFAQRLAMGIHATPVQEAQAFVMLGNVGVSIFFVLSGFLLSFPFWRNYLAGTAFPSIPQYIFRRAARIMPAYYVVFIVSILIVPILNIPGDYFWLRSLAGLTFTSGVHYITFFPSEINGPLWSISFEVICYLIMPIIMLAMFFLLKKRSFVFAIVYWILAIYVILWINDLIHYYLTPGDENRGWQYGNIGGAKFWMPNYNPIGMFAQFAIGILASGVAARLKQQSEKVARLTKMWIFDMISAASLIILLGLAWMLRHAAEFSFSLQNQPFFFPTFTILIAIPLAVGSHTRFFHKLLDNTFFRFTAKISFGLYLWHYMFITLVSMYIAKDYHYSGVVSISRWFIVSAAILVVSYIIATLSYNYIEKPILKWAKNKEKKNKSFTHQEEPTLNS